MEPRSYTQSVVDRNVVMRRISVLTFHSPCWVLHTTDRNTCCNKPLTGIPLQVLTHCVALHHKTLHKIHFLFGPLIKLLRIYWRHVSAQLNLTRTYTWFTVFSKCLICTSCCLWSCFNIQFLYKWGKGKCRGKGKGKDKGKGKGRLHPRTGHEGPKGE